MTSTSTSASARPSPKSWSESLHHYVQDHREHAPSTGAPAPRRTTAPAALNPITTKWNDAEKERVMARHEADRAQAMLVRGVEKAQARARPFNIVSNATLVETPSKAPVPTYADLFFPPREHNIVTNQFTFTDSEARLQREDVERRRREQAKRAQKDTKETRDFDIVLHRYKANDERRRADEEHANAEQLREKWWKVHHYNPITTSFYHPDEERQFQEARAAVMATYGSAKLERLPPGYKRSEGMKYNILAPPPLTPPSSTTIASSASAAASLLEQHPRVRNEMERIRRDEQRECEIGRRGRARRSDKREEIVVRRGYNILTNEPLGTDANPVYPSFAALERQAASQVAR